MIAVAALILTALLAQPTTAIDQFEHLQSQLRRAHERGDFAAYLAGVQDLV